MTLPEKPVAEVYRPELVRLPRLTRARVLFRWVMKGIVWCWSNYCFGCALPGVKISPGKAPR